MKGGETVVASGASRRLIAGGAALFGALAVVLAIRNPSSPLAKVGAIQGTAVASACTVSPRTLPPLDAPPGPDGAASPQTPGTPVTGSADAETILAITTTVRESIACSNAGDFQRGLSLFSDGYVRGLFTGPSALDPAEVASFVATPPVALAAPDQLALVAVREVRVLGDGRVSAIVVTRNARMTFTDLLIFIRVDDRWLIDEFRPAPRPPATPIASPIASPAT